MSRVATGSLWKRPPREPQKFPPPPPSRKGKVQKKTVRFLLLSPGLSWHVNQSSPIAFFFACSFPPQVFSSTFRSPLGIAISRPPLSPHRLLSLSSKNELLLSSHSTFPIAPPRGGLFGQFAPGRSKTAPQFIALSWPDLTRSSLFPLGPNSQQRECVL